MKIKKISIIIDNLELPHWKISLLDKILNFTNLELVSLILIENPNKKSISFMEKILFKLESKRNIYGKSAIDRNNINFPTQKFPNIPIQKFSDLSFNLENSKNDEVSNQPQIDLFIYLGDDVFSSIPKLESDIWYLSFPYDYLPFTQFVGVSSINNETENIHSSLCAYSKLGHFKIIDIFSPVDSLSIKRMSNFHFWTCYLRILEQLEIYSKKSDSDFYNHLSEKTEIPQQTQSVNLVSIFYKLSNNRYLQRSINIDENWTLHYSFETNLSFNFKNFKSIIPPKDRFWADPFVIFRDKKHYIFFEEFLYAKNKGHISFMEIDIDGNYSKPKKILEKPYHLSYPHIFSFESSMFMIPETFVNNSIELYRCEDFPSRWTLEKKLLKGNFVNSNIIFHNEKFWLLTGKKFINLPYVDQTELYYSNSLDDEWKYHPSNPVISNFDWAQNAGKIFQLNDKLIRPSQTFSKGYGHSIILHEIQNLSTEQFSLKEFKKLEPNWDNDYIGIHTLNHSKGLTVIDVKNL